MPLALYLPHAAVVSFPVFSSEVTISANICKTTHLVNTLNQV